MPLKLVLFLRSGEQLGEECKLLSEGAVLRPSKLLSEGAVLRSGGIGGLWFAHGFASYASAGSMDSSSS
tara:strand:- start:1061 stop:1267 length:207 start_codon:yes stop_codon:yes gene_type:complete